jgi:hypothetical protein
LLVRSYRDKKVVGVFVRFRAAVVFYKRYSIYIIKMATSLLILGVIVAISSSR